MVVLLALILAILGAVAGSVAAVMTDRQALRSTIFGAKNFPAPLAFGAVAAAFLFLLYQLTSKRADASISLFDVITAVCLILTVAYAVLTSIRKTVETGALAAFLGIFAVVACILLNAYYYFDVSIEMNAPLKTATQVGLLCAMVYFTGEIRYLLGTPMPRTILMLGAWLISLGALSALAVPVAFFAGKLDRPDYLAGALLSLSAALTALFRLHTLLGSKKNADEAASTPEEDTEKTE